MADGSIPSSKKQRTSGCTSCTYPADALICAEENRASQEKRADPRRSTFMTIAQPTWFTRALVLACQGMAYNMLFLAYIFAPKVVHRFVGALEEEAVRT